MACLRRHKKRGCRGPGDSPATTMPSSDKPRGRKDLLFRGGRVEARFGPATGVDPVPARRSSVVFQPGKARQLLAGLDLLLGCRVLKVGERLAVDFFSNLGERRMLRIAVRPRRVQDWIREFSAILLIQGTDLQVNLRQDVLVEAAIARRRHGRVFPLQPTGGIRHAAVFFRKSRATASDTPWSLCSSCHQSRCLELSKTRSFHPDRFRPQRASPLSSARRYSSLYLDRSLRRSSRTQTSPSHCRGTFDPDLSPGIVAVDLRQVVVGKIVLFGCRVAVKRLEE